MLASFEIDQDRQELVRSGSVARSARILRTVIHVNRLSPLSSRSMRNASAGENLHASTRPQPTPIGVMTSSMGLAMRMERTTARLIEMSYPDIPHLTLLEDVTR
jgi:hypothetical protein